MAASTKSGFSHNPRIRCGTVMSPEGVGGVPEMPSGSMRGLVTYPHGSALRPAALICRMNRFAL